MRRIQWTTQGINFSNHSGDSNTEYSITRNIKKWWPFWIKCWVFQWFGFSQKATISWLNIQNGRLLFGFQRQLGIQMAIEHRTFWHLNKFPLSWNRTDPFSYYNPPYPDWFNQLLKCLVFRCICGTSHWDHISWSDYQTNKRFQRNQQQWGKPAVGIQIPDIKIPETFKNRTFSNDQAIALVPTN